MARPDRIESGVVILGAQILNQRSNPQKKENDDEEAKEAHSPHHSDRHVSHLHHVQTPSVIHAGGSLSRKRSEGAFVLLAAVLTTAVRPRVPMVSAKHVVAANLLRRQE